MNCNGIASGISAYIDGELPLDECRRIEGHAAICDRCRAELDATRHLKVALARLPAMGEPTAAARARIERFAMMSNRGARRPALLLTAAMLMLLIASVMLARAYGRGRFASALVDDHYRSTPAAARPQVESDDPVAVARFFEGRTSFQPFVPVLRDARLVGGRLCSVANSPAELLFYEVGGHAVSVFVAKPTIMGPSSRCTSREGTTVCSANRGDVAVHAVGTLPRERIAAIVSDACSK